MDGGLYSADDLVDSKISNHLSLTAQQDEMELGAVENTLREWNEILDEYSQRFLSFGVDKLPAISGIAAAFARQLQSEYIFGLWKNHLPYGLLWRHGHWYESPKFPRPQLRAPSWSWASVNCRVQYDDQSTISPHFKVAIGMATNVLAIHGRLYLDRSQMKKLWNQESCDGPGGFHTNLIMYRDAIEDFDIETLRLLEVCYDASYVEDIATGLVVAKVAKQYKRVGLFHYHYVLENPYLDKFDKRRHWEKHRKKRRWCWFKESEGHICYAF